MNGELSRDFIEWQVESRLEAFSRMSSMGSGSVSTMPAHLPVMATVGRDPLRINLANKGIGMIPRDDLIVPFTKKLQDVVASQKGARPEETLALRVSVIKEMYSDPENFDTVLLGGLEIFEGQTLNNIRNDPQVTLLFTEGSPKFRSYQIEGNARIVQEGDKYYDYLRMARELFAHDRFHIHQTQYPFGYLIEVGRVQVKTPFPRGPSCTKG
jgi:hypothetical protein